ncbi:hypothetical protein E1178_02610 [Roseibium hamelinense]|nr:hypothetical protein [Roseibium hamelinense]
MNLVTSSEVAAQARPDTRNYTCEQAQALVKQRGQIVMNTGPSTFDRFVANGSYCVEPHAVTRALFAPTKDVKQCNVGRRCVERVNPRSNR